MIKKLIEYHRRWRKNNSEKVRINQRRYRMKNLELCRKRTRLNQIILNDKKRFGGHRIEALERDGYKCQICSKDVSGKRMAHIHHINHNRKDNRLENFTTLCHSCHATHHFPDRKRSKKGTFL